MPAMTMPFNLKDNADFGKLISGEGVEFELIMTEDDSWIRNICQIDASSVELPEKEETISKNTRIAIIKEGDVMQDVKWSSFLFRLLHIRSVIHPHNDIPLRMRMRSVHVTRDSSVKGFFQSIHSVESMRRHH